MRLSLPRSSVPFMLGLAVASAAACRPIPPRTSDHGYKLTRSGAHSEPRLANCEFDVFTAYPDGAWTEVGTVDSTRYGGKTTLASFRDAVRSRVCEAGGDAIIALANGDGQYVKATVLIRSAAQPAQTRDAAVPGAGCSFDAQCKGDRVCEAGRCVEPAAQPAEPTAGSTPQ